MNFDEFVNELNDMPKQLNEGLRRVATLVGNTAQNEFASHFKEQGMNGEKWKNVKRREKPAPKGRETAKARSKRERPILIGPNADLEKAVQKSYSGETLGDGTLTVHMVAASDHGEYLNEGTPKMVARPFMGETPRLDNKIVKILEDNIKLG